MTRPSLIRAWTFGLTALVLASAPHVIAQTPAASSPAPARTLDEYRHFRAASIDLLGRMPTRDEIAAFERADFNFDTWIDRHVSGSPYVDRLTRVYMDQLRLEPNLMFSTSPAQLHRHTVQGPDGKDVFVYFREGQRRAREATDGEFCLSPDETGLVIRARRPTTGTAKKVSQELLDQNTVLVKPWWLYRDYKSASPTKLYKVGWDDPDPGYQPIEPLLTNPDGSRTETVRVCREEAQVAETGHIYASGRVKAPGPKAPPTPKPPKGAKPPPVIAPTASAAATAMPVAPPPPPAFPGGRTTAPPMDKPYAKDHKGEPVACDTKTALENSIDCGCGVGLERCIPSESDQGAENAFYFPNHMPLGPENPLDSARQQSSRWFPYWWSREAVHFFGYLFGEDRDFREVLTSHTTVVNGPLAQFYKSIQRGNCCGQEAQFGMTEETEPLFDPKRVPADLQPHDVATWKTVADRGPHSSGILTMPMFLQKFASARARGAVLYNVFLCKSFLSEKAQLTPSTEPNLMIRPGCQNCHATLEPLAAYFARVESGNFVFLPQDKFPVKNATCKKNKQGRLGVCDPFYDVAFSDGSGAMLRSAYGSPANTDAAPAGAGHDITQSPDFASCAVERFASSFLGRPLTSEDDSLKKQLTTSFTTAGYKPRALIRAILQSDAYRRANNLSSANTGAASGAPATNGGAR